MMHHVQVSAPKVGCLRAGTIDQTLQGDPVSRVRLQVPQKEGKLLAMLEARSRLYSRQYKDGLVELEAEAPESVVRKVREYVVPGNPPAEN